MLEEQRNRTFNEWMKAHSAILVKVSRAYGASDSDIEDLVQEIAIQLWISMDSFRGESNVTTWIYRVALNTALAWKRKERKHVHGKQDFETVNGLLLSPPERDPRLDWIYEMIGRLDELSRSLVLLMLDGFSYREMSEILGISESNVGVKLNRIKSELANAQTNEGYRDESR